MQLNIKQRYEIIVRNEMGHSIRKIAADMNINHKTVQRWLKKYKSCNNVDRNNGSGRKKIINDDQINIILDIIKSDNLLTANQINEKIKYLNINIATQTIRNILHSHNYEYIAPQEKPLLTESHKRKRSEWALKYLNTDWRYVIFSDEASTWKGLCGHHRWVNKNDVNDVEKIVKHPIKRHIWGMISRTKINHIHIFDGILDADKYVDILTQNLSPKYKNNLIFQQDNDPKHTSKKVQKMLADNNIKYLDWPSNSPDLNPIENVWSILKMKIAKHRTNSTGEFEKCIIDEWNNISFITISNIIKSMPVRIMKVIANNGDLINY